MQELLSKLYLGKHYRMERFGVLFLVLLIGLVGVTMTISIKYKQEMSHQLTDQALYTSKFAMSITGASGVVKNVYTSADHKKAFVLVKFDDATNISTRAEEYEMFLTGSSIDLDKTSLKTNPKGSIYMFGSTGYMGVYLVAEREFDEQILDLVVRCNRQLIETGEASTEEKDASFSKYDQFRVYFNPGAASTEISDVLNTNGEMRVADMYEEFIIKPQEKDVRTLLTTDLNTLKIDLDRIKEYEDRLHTAQIQIPEAPEVIRGDSYVVDKNGTMDDEKDDSIRLSSAKVVPGGFDFNWQDGSVQNGYLRNLAGNSTFSAYLAAKADDSKDTPSGDPKVCYTPFSVAGIEWHRVDGSVFDVNINSSNATSVDIAIAKDIQNLQSAWQTYYADKKKYQQTDLRQLLMMEADVVASSSNFTINNSDKVLKIW